MRKEETRCAVGILGGDRNAIRFLDVEDATLASHVEFASEKLSEIIHEVAPDEIFVTSEYEQHSDHVAACGAVRLAMQKTQSSAKLYRYTVLLRPGLSLSSIADTTKTIDITEQLQTKRLAVGQFNSHLKIIAKQQTQPFFESVDPWLETSETFFV